MKVFSIPIAGLMFFAAFTFLPCYAEQTSEAPKTVEQLYPNLAASVLTYAKVATLPEGVLLKSEDVEISSKDIDAAISSQPEQFRAELKKNAFFILEQEATGKLLAKFAKKKLSEKDKNVDSMDDNQLIKVFFEDIAKGVKISDDDIEKFYKENESIFCGTPLESVRKQIENYVLQDKQQRLVDQYIQTLGQKIEIHVSDSWTKTQTHLAKDNPLDKARSNGKPTLAIFSAASCCGPDKMISVRDALLRKYDTKINIVYIEPSKEQILAARYAIRSIPTQVFYDNSGKEFYRHSGFSPVDEIEKKLRGLGVN